MVEQYPISKDSGYTRLQSWIDKDEYRVRKIDFYDRKGALLKTLTPSEYQKYLGKHWRAQKMNMVNHQTGKSTDLVWSEFKFKTGLKDDDFMIFGSGAAQARAGSSPAGVICRLNFRPDFTAAQSGLEVFIHQNKDFIGKEVA